MEEARVLHSSSMSVLNMVLNGVAWRLVVAEGGAVGWWLKGVVLVRLLMSYGA